MSSLHPIMTSLDPTEVLTPLSSKVVSKSPKVLPKVGPKKSPKPATKPAIVKSAPKPAPKSKTVRSTPTAPDWTVVKSKKSKKSSTSYHATAWYYVH